MNARITGWIALGVVAAAIAGSLWARQQLPEGALAVHFDAAGNPNGFLPRDQALALGPVAVALCAGLIMLTPRWPGAQAPQRSPAAWYGIGLSLILVMLAAHAMILAAAFGLAFRPAWPLTAAGLLLIVVGNLLPKMRRNRLMGLRTPWTLADEAVWEQTHTIMALPFMLAGAVIMVLPLFMPPAMLPGLVAALAAGLALAAFAVSRHLARRKKP